MRNFEVPPAPEPGDFEPTSETFRRMDPAGWRIESGPNARTPEPGDSASINPLDTVNKIAQDAARESRQ